MITMEPYKGRETVATMYRVKNEARWIRRSLERTFLVASRVVIFDDGSTDNTAIECKMAVGETATTEQQPWGWIAKGMGAEGERELHFLSSPFTQNVRAKERVNEVRDKNILWAYIKSTIDCQHFLCLDGDEFLTKAAVRNFNVGINLLESTYDALEIPVLYLWNAEDQIRVDGVYGRAGDGLPQLRFPRLFTIKRMSEDGLFNMHFESRADTAAGFHCGSVPMVGFTPNGKSAVVGLFKFMIGHWGYIDKDLRSKKFEFYTTLDPESQSEGGYVHIIEKQNYYCQGAVRFGQWSDV